MRSIAPYLFSVTLTGCLITPIEPPEQPTPCTDGDGDGYGQGDLCLGEDCDDEDADTHPAAEELCDGADNDCDGDIDEDLATTTWYLDLDEDGYGDEDSAVEGCAQPAGTVQQPGDCDDQDDSAYPGAEERCDGDLEACGGAVDEGCRPLSALYVTNFEDGTVSVVDIELNRVVTHIEVGAGPRELGVSEDGDTVVVPLALDDAVALVDTSSLEVQTVLSVKGSCEYPRGSIMRGDELLLTCSDGVLAALDIVSGTITQTTEGSAYELERFEGTLYARAKDAVAILDQESLETLTVSPEVGDSSYQDLEHDPGRGRILVSDSWEHAVHLFDDTSLEHIESWDDWTTWPSGLLYDAEPDRIYLVDRDTWLYVLDAETGEEQETLELPVGPAYLAMPEDRSALWVVTTPTGAVGQALRLDPSTWEITHSLELGTDTNGLLLLEAPAD
jgi:YVTN family beta-propeller protein